MTPQPPANKGTSPLCREPVPVKITWLATLLLCLTAITLSAQATVPGRGDIVLADFEGKDYGAWKVTGTAFGPGPAQGTLPGQMRVTGFLGHGLADSFLNGDSATGTLTSPDFVVTRKYVNFLIGGGGFAGRTCINLVVGGVIRRTATGQNIRSGGVERLDWFTWDVSRLQGTTAHLEILDRATGGWGHINVDEIRMSDHRMADEIETGVLYGETYRPQFHFTAKQGWLNDPNGMVYYAGEYHLFFQRNPVGLTSDGIMSWGHAVSRDLVHWEEIADALTPDALGPIWSGSAVMDVLDTTGFRVGAETPMVAMYTAAGGFSPLVKGTSFTQCLAYSGDKGRTWTKYAGNPVIPHIVGGNRDPKVVWHAPTKRWIMALYLDGEDYGLFSSPDMKTWTRTQTLHMPGSTECPDFFDLPVVGDPNRRKWVFTGANGRYFVGSFDGATFTPEVGPLPEDFGGNFYAVQTFADMPGHEGRCVQIAWMNDGVYPKMPFNQQMSFPCDLTLHQTPDGLRLRRWPAKEIDVLHAEGRKLRGLTLHPGDANPLAGLAGDLWDIEADFEVPAAGAGASPPGSTAFGIRARGEDVRYNVADQTITSLGRHAALPITNHHVTLRLLVDRTSLEVFGNAGQVSMTSCFLPARHETGLSVYAEGGPITLVSLVAHPLRSAWSKAVSPPAHAADPAR